MRGCGGAGGRDCGDGQDNDCDGETDENIDLATDGHNCGACGNDCADPISHPESQNAWAYCDAGQCQRTCKAGYWDVDDDFDPDRTVPMNGCEYRCDYTGPEVCDGLDNDCNTLLDEQDPALLDPGNFCQQDGACAGAQAECRSYTPPAPAESGDQTDQLAGWTIAGATERNTSAGLLYVTLSDSGGVRTVSLFADATRTDLVAAGSLAGDGVVQLAAAGSSGLSGSVTVTYSADDADLVIALPITTWVCSYGPTVELVGLNQIAPEESRCDNLDNDCDGEVDEPFFGAHAKGSYCEQDGTWGAAVHGECRGHGRWVCEGCLDPTAPCPAGGGASSVCDLTCGSPTCKLETTGSAEICDGQDNDCDGQIDDDIVDDMVHVTGAASFWILPLRGLPSGRDRRRPGHSEQPRLLAGRRAPLDPR